MARRRKGHNISGWIVIDKPTGLTSARVVGRVRQLYQAAKAGHAGTLDPLATGVLPIAMGEATKTVPYVTDDRKSYRFTLRWGVATSTDDLEGDVIARSDQRPDRAAIEAVLPSFTGRIAQVPPRYSAVKVEGRRAYDRARAQETFELRSRLVEIDAIGLIDQPSFDEATFEVICGKGTYMRSLARDLGETLGTRAHITALRRLAVGPFTEGHAISLRDRSKSPALWSSGVLHGPYPPTAYREPERWRYRLRDDRRTAGGNGSLRSRRDLSGPRTQPLERWK
jgi:tRNA pseudouridine55 synthase